MSRSPFYILHSAVYILTLLALAACGGSNTDTAEGHDTDSARRTEADIVLALMPTIDCLPYYVAEDAGFYKEAGVKVHLLPIVSQWDCDTAIVGTTHAVGVMDSVRLAYRQSMGDKLETLCTTAPQEWVVVACGTLRLRRPEQLRHRSIATSRHTAADHLIESVFRKAGNDFGEALLPQVNALPLRALMLDNNQVDAALLPEPYAGAARAAGHRVLATAPEDAYRGRIVATAATTALPRFRENWEKVQRAAERARQKLEKEGKAAAAPTLAKRYGLSAAAIDSIYSVR